MARRPPRCFGSWFSQTSGSRKTGQAQRALSDSSSVVKLSSGARGPPPCRSNSSLLTPFNLGGPQTREAFDALRGELARLFLTSAVGQSKDRERARKVLSSLLAPEPRRGPPANLAVTQRNAIVGSYLAGVDDPDVRAERMAELENRILPACQENLQWPDDVSIDLDSVIRSVARRKA